MVENVRGVNVDVKLTHKYLGRDNLGDPNVNGIIVLKMGVRPN
jgi:hypothetical protein